MTDVEQALRVLEGGDPPSWVDGLEQAAGGGYRMLTIRDLAELPAPSYLVQDFIRRARSTPCSAPSGLANRSSRSTGHCASRRTQW